MSLSGNELRAVRLAGLMAAGVLMLSPALADTAEAPASDKLAELGRAAIERGAVIGDPDAEITIYEFTDYNCGYCRRGVPGVFELVETYPDAKVVLIDYPKLGEDSKAAAGVLLDVSSVGTYRLLHDHLMTMSGRATREDVDSEAAKLGLVESASPVSQWATEILDEHLAFGEEIGIRGVPTYTIDGEHQVHTIWKLEKALCGYEGPGSCGGFGVLIEDAVGVAQEDPAAAGEYARRAAADVIDRGTFSEMNMVCWDGAKARLARDVLPACDAAVEARPDSASVRDSRGLARALAGDLDGAIADFEFIVAENDPESEQAVSRQAAIDALRAGDDPFRDDAYLAEF